ncbi:Transposon Ty3-I Gag-Pol polyprotein [Sesbania bispinosa]|nr:Transposon Ty3-I Gag-Pol polyprotein [Sesbania bispinosa]
MAWSQPRFEFIPLLRSAIKEDGRLQQILELCNQNQPPHPNYTTHDQLLYWKGRLVIPSKHTLVQQILNEFHSSLIGRHVGGNQHIRQHLVQWEGLVVEHANWEDHPTPKATFPNLNLEDKIALNGGGIVTSENTERTNEEMHKGESQDAMPERKVTADVQSAKSEKENE